MIDVGEIRGRFGLLTISRMRAFTNSAIVWLAARLVITSRNVARNCRPPFSQAVR
jgi:hypothetical protein